LEDRRYKKTLQVRLNFCFLLLLNMIRMKILNYEN